MVGHRQKMKKRPKAVSKKLKFAPKYRWFKISSLKLFFWKYYFRHTTFSYSFKRASGHHQSFFNLRSSRRKPQRQKGSLVLQYSFAHKISHILGTSTGLALTITCSSNTAKNLSEFTNFPWNMFIFGVRKKTFALYHFLKPKNYILVCIFLCISVRRFLFQRRSKILFGGNGSGRDWIIYLRGLTVWAS